MSSCVLNFASFFQCVVKGNTCLTQYDAVSVLLLGKRRQDCMEAVISDSAAANYTKGKSRIRNDLLTEVLLCSHDELKRRFFLLGFQNIQPICEAAKKLLNATGDFSGKIDAARPDSADPYDLIVEVFLLALKCPPRSIHPLTKEDQAVIKSCRESVAQPLSDEDMGRDTSQEEVQSLSPISERLIDEYELSLQMIDMKCRKLNIPQDIPYIADIFLKDTDNGIISIGYSDVQAILSSETSNATFWYWSLYGDLKEIHEILKNTASLKKCTALSMFLHTGENFGLSDLEGITKSIQDACSEDVDISFGMKMSSHTTPIVDVRLLLKIEAKCKEVNKGRVPVDEIDLLPIFNK